MNYGSESGRTHTAPSALVILFRSKGGLYSRVKRGCQHAEAPHLRGGPRTAVHGGLEAPHRPKANTHGWNLEDTKSSEPVQIGWAQSKVPELLNWQAIDGCRPGLYATAVRFIPDIRSVTIERDPQIGTHNNRWLRSCPFRPVFGVIPAKAGTHGRLTSIKARGCPPARA